MARVVGKTAQVSSDTHLKVNQYLGIPFAESPPRRFEPPVDPPPWNTPWDASYFRPSCIQSFPGSCFLVADCFWLITDNLPDEEFKVMFNNPPLPESEDCLYLNIFTPSTPRPEGLPVLFWIHGGGFTLGSARVPDYDGSSLAANQGLVVVTINYRLNVFGFPGSSAIPFERRNIGLMDQRKALSWVSMNIRAFGGDPSKVTIYGESAGGWSVKQLLINPPSPIQYRGAILQSQAFGPRGNNEVYWDRLVRELNCNSTDIASSHLDCVANAPAESIRSITEGHRLWFTPVDDNATNGPSFIDAVQENRAARVPILIGTTADEGSILSSVMPSPELMFAGIFGVDTDSQRRARLAYPDNATEEELRSFIITDYTYTCSTSAVSRSAANVGYKVWRYYFNASFPNNQPFPGAGAWHTSEIPIVFGNYRQDDLLSEEQVMLSRSMQQAWGNFAKSPESGPGWATVGLSNVEFLTYWDI
ncbi:Para-nitrobenzyl esterase [Paramyrothecium foliicola]|nr:Para-nitrobenzyl esterase [Paramyrothecium foliicola]